jgi:diguanylate cyclase (GGDEF)-like protein
LIDDLKQSNEELREIANLDPLTGVMNRRGLDAVFALELHRIRRLRLPGDPASELIAVLIDCDDFKSVNDSSGHTVGDRVLQSVATRLQAELRASDHLARIGGDEFLALLPHSDLDNASRIAHRLRDAVVSRPIAVSVPDAGEARIRVTISLGVGMVLPVDEDLDGALARLSPALKQSKHLGKNRVSVVALHG